MKKILIGLAIASTIATVGCAAKSGNVPVEASACYDGAPSWVLMGGAEGGISAVGSAPLSAAGINHARTEALANARTEIARQMGLKVSNMVKNFVQTTGVGDQQTVDKVSSSITRQLTNQTVTGSKQVDAWVPKNSECKEIFVLVAVDANSFQKELKAQAISSFQNEQAIWQQIQAKNAMDEMDKAIQDTMNASNKEIQQNLNAN